VPTNPASSEESITALPQKNVQEEKPATELQTNHVVLDIQGLTCTGCEADLSRALQKISGVNNLRTSLMLARAEFDLHEPELTLDELIQSVERSTGFTLSQRQADGDFRALDLLVNDIHKDFTLLEKVNGVQDITKLDKHIIRISYDPNVIGARTLLRECLDQVIDLAPAHSTSDQEVSRKHLHSLTRTTLISILLTIPVLVLAWARLPSHLVAYQSTSSVLATIIQIFVAGPFYPPTLRALILHHVLEADLLIVVSTSAAYILSVVDYIYLLAAGHSIKAGGAETTYFQASTLLITLVMVGRTLSAYARQKVIDFISTKSLQAQTANLCTTTGRFVEELDVRLVQYGDHFLVQPHTRIPTDGVIVSGTTEVDESQVTGESIPVVKNIGSSVLAGSWNRSGVVVVRLTQLPGTNTISKINAAVDEAKFSKTHTAQVVDRVRGYFVPVVLCLTVITFGIWLAIGLAVRHQSGREAAITAVTYALAVLIISCPCGLCLIVPLVTVVAGSVAARHGMIVKSASTFEQARKISHVVFDKTGTLTTVYLSVVEEIYLTGDRTLAASLALALTKDSEHPVSQGICTYLSANQTSPASTDNLQSLLSQGMEATYYGTPVRCGNTRWLNLENRPDVLSMSAANLTVVGLTLNGALLALYGLSSKIRPEAETLIESLRAEKIGISILSGDDVGPVNAVAAELGIALKHVRARCTPQDKQTYVAEMTAAGKQVLFIGDGTNDAPALAAATIGVHIPSTTSNTIVDITDVSATNPGHDITHTAADVVLLRPSLTAVLDLLDLSRALYRRLVLALAWSFVYNLLAMALAGGAFMNARIPPQWAALGELVSVLPVIAIALTLAGWKRPRAEEKEDRLEVKSEVQIEGWSWRRGRNWMGRRQWKRVSGLI